MNLKLLYPLFFSSFMVSCIEEVDDFDDLHEEKTVVTCVIEAKGELSTTYLSGSVYKNQSLFEDYSYTEIENSDYRVSINSVENKLIWIGQYQGYRSEQEILVKPEDDCFLKIVMEDGSLIKSSCKIPKENKIKIENTTITKDGNNINFSANWELEDVLGYGKTRVLLTVKYDFYRSGEYEYKYDLFDYFANGEKYPEYLPQREFSFSTTIEEQDIRVSLANELEKGEFDSLFISFVNTDISVHVFDVNLAEYEKAVYLQQKNANDPFAEPVIIPSNIDGGLGVFGGIWSGVANKEESTTFRVK